MRAQFNACGALERPGHVGAMSNLFSAAGLDQDVPRPLADRLRPKHLGEIAGQEHLLGQHGQLTRLIGAGAIGSLIF
jgi:putative ATPase